MCEYIKIYLPLMDIWTSFPALDSAVGGGNAWSYGSHIAIVRK